MVRIDNSQPRTPTRGIQPIDMDDKENKQKYKHALAKKCKLQTCIQAKSSRRNLMKNYYNVCFSIKITYNLKILK